MNNKLQYITVDVKKDYGLNYYYPITSSLNNQEYYRFLVMTIKEKLASSDIKLICLYNYYFLYD
jgi:hypothetical protein